jgi:prephenate dehydrogenase
MTIQITIIGLGQIGTSVGLVLAEQNELIKRVGYDRDQGTARKAEKMGALDRVAPNLRASVRDADMVLLSLPMDQIRETLDIIGPELREGVVVMDTGPVKEVVAAWAGELLPPGRHYIGLTPVINPAYLHEAGSGVDAAKPDLFRGGLIAIVATPRVSSEAIKLAADLTRLLGSMPLFADPTEVDSQMAATHLLPQLLAAALLNATVDQPGWREGRKIAGRAYAESTGPIAHMSEPQTLRASIMLNRDNMLRLIDSTVASLLAFRNDINDENHDALKERLERARQGRDRWWKQRQAADWANIEAVSATEYAETPDIFGRLLGLGRKPKTKK